MLSLGKMKSNFCFIYCMIQYNTAKGAHVRFALYCFIIFIIKGNTELRNVLLADFIPEQDERGLLLLT